MKKCPKCGETKIDRGIMQGLAEGGSKYISDSHKGLSRLGFKAYKPSTAYACTSCGYLECYLNDPSTIEK